MSANEIADAISGAAYDYRISLTDHDVKCLAGRIETLLAKAFLAGAMANDCDKCTLPPVVNPYLATEA